MKQQSITHEQAVNAYFGGVKQLAKSMLPFTCKCGGLAYGFSEMYKHIRKDHKEVIKKDKKLKV